MTGRTRSPSWSPLAQPGLPTVHRVEDLPWISRDLTRTTVVVGLGAAGLAVCWYGSSGTDVYDSQLAWIVGGTVAVAFAACGLVSWLLSGLRAVRQERLVVLVALDLLRRLAGPQAAPAGPAGAVLLTAPGMTIFHREGCQLLRGKPATAVDPAAITRAGLHPCGVCEP